jgi:protein-S-isoprenylcysteine O-methyltransferase Ste14
MSKENDIKDVTKKQLKALIWIGGVFVVALAVLIVVAIAAAVGIVAFVPIAVIAGIAAALSLILFIFAGPVWIIINRKNKHKAEHKDK